MKNEGGREEREKEEDESKREKDGEIMRMERGRGNPHQWFAATDHTDVTHFHCQVLSSLTMPGSTHIAPSTAAAEPDNTKMGRGGKEVEIIGILSSSQGKIAVVSALLAGIGYTVLTSITSEELLLSPYIGFCFILSSTTVVAGNIFVAIICSMSEQEGEIAQAMSLLRESRSFDLQLEKWWQKFSPLRTQSVWIFYFSVPLLFTAVAFLSLIKWPVPFSYLVAGLFLLFGALTTQKIFWLSSIFRSDVLLIETFQEVKYNTKLKRVLSTRDSLRYSPPSTPSAATVSDKRMKSFSFPEEGMEEKEQKRGQHEEEILAFQLPQSVSEKQKASSLSRNQSRTEGSGKQGPSYEVLSIESSEEEDNAMLDTAPLVPTVAPTLRQRQSSKKRKSKTKKASSGSAD
jgi:hypothetical protein